MAPPPHRLARPLLVVAVVLAVLGGVAAGAEDGSSPGIVALEDQATSSTSSSTTSSSTSTSTTLPADAAATTSVPPAPSPTAPRPPTTRPPASTPTTQAPVPTVPPTTAPPSIPGGTIQLLVTNESGHIVDISVNMGFLRLGPGQSYDGLAAAELGADGDVAPGSDLVTVSVAAGFGHPDEGCGSHQLGQLFSPGGSYRMRITTSGTCQLLGGSGKPTFSIARR